MPRTVTAASVTDPPSLSLWSPIGKKENREERKKAKQRNILETPVVHTLSFLLTYPNNTEETDGTSGSLVAAESAIFYQGTSLLVSPDG